MIDIEVELSIQHTRLHVGADKLVVAVSLANHPKRTVGITGLHLMSEHAPIVQGDVLAGIVTIAVEVVLVYPVEGGIRHGLANLLTLKVERWNVLVEPCRQSGLIPEFEIAAPVRQDAVRNPVGVCLQRRGIDVHVVSHIVENDIDAVLMCRGKQFLQLCISTHAVVNLRIVDRPVAMIAGELGLGIVILSPGILRILRNRRYPQRVDA